MLPKDLLKYARKFSPVEIENAIKTAIDHVGRAISGQRLPDNVDWRTLQDLARMQLTTYPTTTTITYNPWTYTTTDTVSSQWVYPSTMGYTTALK